MSPRAAVVCSLLPISALALAGCSADAADDEAGEAAAVTVAAENGEVEVPQDPADVVVFDNAQLDILDALEVDVAGIPSADAVPTFFSAYAEDETVADVGSLFEPDFEEVAAIDPDLIISGGRSADATEELAEIAPTLDMSLETGNTLASLSDRAQTYGEIFDRTEQADLLATELEERTNEVGEQVAEAGDGLVLITSSGEISAYGPGSRYGFFYDDLGMEPAVEISSSEASHGEVLSFEALAEADPDWLYVIDRDTAIGEEGASPAEQVLDNDLVADTTAAEEDQILHLDSEEVYLVGGIQAHLNVLDDIDSALS